jgi:orotidine-5'-phosphate decarboxylase
MTGGAATHFADRLIDAMDRAGAPTCVGVDPVFEKLPQVLQRHTSSKVHAIERFSVDLVRAVAGVVAAVKPQSACFERYGSTGMLALERVCAEARDLGLVVILDAKRGDIGTTSEHYAAAAFEGYDADAVTVSPYLGAETLRPFLDTGEKTTGRTKRGRGVFVLVRTSNPDSDKVQGLTLRAGGSVALRVASLVAKLGEGRVGERGYSDVGAVVAATKPKDAAKLREAMPEQLFLVPGYGAQGGTAETVRELFDAKGRGAIITASRSVIYAFNPKLGDWAPEVRAAAERFNEEIAGVRK